MWELGGRERLVTRKKRGKADPLWAAMVRSTASYLRNLFPFCSWPTADPIWA